MKEFINSVCSLKKIRLTTSKVLGITFVLLLFISGASVRANDIEPIRDEQESFIKRAVFFDERLWLLSDAGLLFNIVEGKDTINDSLLPEPALDLYIRDGHLEAITCPRDDSREWTLRRWIDGKWLSKEVVPAKGDSLLGVSCSAEKVTLVTNRRLVDLSNGKQHTVKLSEMLKGSLVSSIYVTSDHVFIGINAGEWGGGLRRIDRRSGKVIVIEKNISGELCGGPLNTDCDPINGIAPEPWKSDCIAIAIGLVHFFSHGRIVEVCADQAETIFLKAYGDPEIINKIGEDGEPVQTVAFFGLTRVDNELWATGIDGIYKIEAPGKVQSISLPDFKNIGGIYVSFDIPKIVLVLTDINMRKSISGSVPMIVPR